MRPWTILPTAAAFCIGCTHITLERRTINQASTLSDLQYRQVLDNLAMFLCNRGALPWHLRLAAGTVQVADQGFLSVLANTIHKAQVSPTVSAQRTGVGQWDVDPAVDADDLELLQLAYQKTVDPADLTIDRRIDEQICELCIRFDLLPNENALKRLFTAGDAVSKIQEALVAVCNELSELDKLQKFTELGSIESPCLPMPRPLPQRKQQSQQSQQSKKPQQNPNPQKEKQTMCCDSPPTIIANAWRNLKSKEEANRLLEIIRCLRSRSKEESQSAKDYCEKVREELVKRKMDLFRAWEIVASEILRSAVVGGNESVMAMESRGFVRTVSFDYNQPQPAAAKHLVLMVMHLICDPGYMPPAATPESTRRNVGLIAQAEDKIQKLEQLIENTQFTTPWFHCGKLKDVPKCACYVGHYCNCGCDLYVWVMPEQLEVLKDFVLVVLGLAPIDKQDILSGNPTGRGTAFSPAFTGAAH